MAMVKDKKTIDKLHKTVNQLSRALDNLKQMLGEQDMYINQCPKCHWCDLSDDFDNKCPECGYDCTTHFKNITKQTARNYNVENVSEDDEEEGDDEEEEDDAEEKEDGEKEEDEEKKEFESYKKQKTNGVIIILSKEVLTKRLVALGLKYFLENTTLLYDLAGEATSSVSVAMAVEIAVSDYMKYLVKNMKVSQLTAKEVLLCMNAISMQKPMILKAMLQDYPEALLELERYGTHGLVETKK